MPRCFVPKLGAFCLRIDFRKGREVEREIEQRPIWTWPTPGAKSAGNLTKPWHVCSAGSESSATMARQVWAQGQEQLAS